MRYSIFTLILLGLWSCQQAPNTSDDTPTASSHFQAELSDAPKWKKDELRLIPITATAEFIEQQAAIAEYAVLGQALAEERFRVSEKKPYGRFEDSGAVNQLTVQNKTEKDVFLMAGDIVQGGNQDRVIGEDQVIAARSIQDIPVFCVEQGRWTYNGDHVLTEADKKVFAFRGYFNVASKEIRQSVHQKDQAAVWNSVANVSKQYGVQSSTSAYASINDNEELQLKRLNLERFFSDKLDENENIIGFIALSNGKVIGADVMGHPALLNKQFNALLNAYLTDAVLLNGTPKTVDDKLLATLAVKILQDLDDPTKGFRVNKQLVHFAYLP